MKRRRIRIEFTRTLNGHVENGWIDDDGADFEPDSFEEVSAVDLVVQFLREERAEVTGRGLVASRYYVDSGAGEVEARRYELEGFSTNEVQEILARMASPALAGRAR